MGRGSGTGAGMGERPGLGMWTGMGLGPGMGMGPGMGPSRGISNTNTWPHSNRNWNTNPSDINEENITKIGKINMKRNSSSIFNGQSGIDGKQIVGLSIRSCKEYITKYMDRQTEYLEIIPVEIKNRKAIIVLQNKYGYLFKLTRSHVKFIPSNSPDPVTPLVSSILVSPRGVEPFVEAYLTNDDDYIFLGDEVFDALHVGPSSELSNILFVDAAVNSLKPVEFLKRIAASQTCELNLDRDAAVKFKY